MAEKIDLFPEEVEILKKVRELRDLREDGFKVLSLNYDKNILFILDVLKELGIQHSKSEFGFLGLYLYHSNLIDIVNGIKLGMSRSQLKRSKSNLGGRKPRVLQIYRRISGLGYEIFTEKGARACKRIENEFQKSTIYEALRTYF